jgi:hypothetical protein
MLIELERLNRERKRRLHSWELAEEPHVGAFLA